MQILRTILTVTFCHRLYCAYRCCTYAGRKAAGTWWSDFRSSGFLLGKEQSRSMEGGLVKATTIMAVLIFCTGSSFEYEFLRIVRRKHSCINTRVLFFAHSKGVYVSKKKIWEKKKNEKSFPKRKYL